MLNQTILKKLSPGNEVTDFFVVRKKQLRTKKSDGSLYLALELGNATGRIAATIWEEVEKNAIDFQIGDIVKVHGHVNEYMGSNNLAIEKIRRANANDQISPDDFLPEGKKDRVMLQKELQTLLQSIGDPALKQLLQKIFTDEKLQPAFTVMPAGKLWHHNRLGGLLEHSLSVATICDYLAQHYAEIHRDLLVTAALLHDFGKIGSYRTDQGFIDYTDEGRLIGHLAIGADYLNRFIAEVPNFPTEHRKQLLHLILSHHGEIAKGSPVVPMTLEALVLYYADELDSKIDAFLRIADSEKEGPQHWSQYVKLMDRFFYLPPSTEEAHTSTEE